jgi:hypothetical integral membrane protein (TIGR02206 family)
VLYTHVLKARRYDAMPVLSARCATRSHAFRSLVVSIGSSRAQPAMHAAATRTTAADDRTTWDDGPCPAPAATVRQFSVEHLAALGVLVAVASLSVWAARRDRATVAISRTLAVIVLAGWVGEQVADVVEGIWSVKYTLPLQLTDVVSITAVIALWHPRPLLVELTYFWALTASLQATLTPDLARTFPSAFYFTYFAYHVGAVVAALLLVFGRRLYPRPGAAWRVFAATLVVTAVAGAADLITSGNYMYLRTKPEHSSLLSVMARWPWYIAETALLAIAMLLALEALTSAIRRRDARARPVPG